MNAISQQLQPLINNQDPNSRVEALQQLLGYPFKQLDPEGSRFWYLHPGKNQSQAQETSPIAVGFYPQLTGMTDTEAKQFFTSPAQQQEIYGHYTNRIFEAQPVMYLLLPSPQASGRVAFILPTEGGLRQTQIQTFNWGDSQLVARLKRLTQTELPIAVDNLTSTPVPLVEWVFYEPIQTSQELAQLLAKSARVIEQIIPEVYHQELETGYLHNLLKSFQRELLPSLKLSSDNDKDYSFADIYAQTIAYALFTARVFGYVKDRKQGHNQQTLFDRKTAWEQLPETNPFLRQLFEDISQRTASELGDELIGAIAEIFGILRAAKMEAILCDFEMKMNREDIVIRFYEDFLAAYKPQMRERRGVYYTPEPVVSYMVRSVDILVQEKFNKPLGLADPEVMILDPACGTGTFLLWICQLIYQRFQESGETMTVGLVERSWSGYVKERLLPRIFGFELLMAPYAICHLKLGLFLEETGYKFDGGVRLGVYLTNTLDDAIKKSETLFEEYIAEESNQAAKIKVEQQISIIIGNPPYSGISSNLTDAAIKLVEAFRYVDGVKIVEKSALQFEKNINDDYVKFFGVSQKILAKEKNKILCLITNNGYIDSLTLRGLRNNLIIHFDTINITNLHGDIKRKQSPNDQNVFDISQGVAIGFFLKDKSHKKSFSRIDLIGSRNEKYCILNRETISSSDNYQINPSSPFYFFTNQNQEIKNEYESYASIDSIFSEFSSGTETGFDKLMIGFDKLELENKIQDFLNPMCEREAIIDKWSIKGGTSQKILDIRDEFRKDFQESYFSQYLYRVFDNRFIYYKKDYLKTNSEKIMSHLSIHGNLAMILFRQQSQDGFAHVFITNCMGDKNAVSLRTREINYYFPLYVDIQANSSIFFQDQDSKRSNLKSEFVSKISENLCCSFKPETIFYYIYSIFHSPTYRTRYAEFLKIDFPRVPLTSNNELFCQLAEYGQELAALHLMKSPQLNNLITEFTENGGGQIVDPGHPKYIQGAVVINKKGDKFTGVPEQVWNFYIGGYQVCQKWLKDRKGRTLNNEDILHYQRVVVALQETIKLMQLIDQTIPSFPVV